MMAHFDRQQTVLAQGEVTVAAGASPGIVVVFDGTAEPFRSGVFDSQTVFLSRRAGDMVSVEGYSVRTDADGDEWYSRLERRGEDGRYEITGGTGKYLGLTGTCSYGTTALSDGGGVNLASCEWRR